MDIVKSSESRSHSIISSNGNCQMKNGDEHDHQVYSLPTEINVPRYFARKRPFVRILGLLLLVLFLPITLLVMLVVRLTSPGPALFRQRRVGKGGREFNMYKIRTMYQDAEKDSGPVWCQPADARVTSCGRVLRHMHLDELPQLVNIVRGEMDLIGPRPERPEFVEKLVEEVPGFAERLSVLPGVTGLAQINLPPDVTTHCVRKKLVLDLEYIQTANWELDLRIMACTALRMIGVRYGLAVRWLRLDCKLPQRENFPQNGSPPESLPPSIGLPQNPWAMNSTQVTVRQESHPESYGVSQDGSPHFDKKSTQPDTSSLSTFDPVETGDISSLPKNPK